jgi:hypothetical protein
MAEQLPNGHDLSPLLQQVGGKGVAETVTARADPRGSGIAGHLLLNRLDRQRPAEPFLVPEHQVSWHTGRASLQALPQARESIGRQIDIAIFAPFALLNAQGVWVQSMSHTFRRATSDTRKPHRSMSRNNARSIGCWMCANNRSSGSCARGFGRGRPRRSIGLGFTGFRLTTRCSMRKSKKCFSA